MYWLCIVFVVGEFFLMMIMVNGKVVFVLMEDDILVVFVVLELKFVGDMICLFFDFLKEIEDIWLIGVVWDLNEYSDGIFVVGFVFCDLMD